MQHWLKQYTAQFGIFFFSLALFLWGLGPQEVISFDSRFYLFALEMWRHGVSWFPTTYHQPYPDYTVASTFLIYLCANMFGGLSKVTAVMPTAIAAALTAVFTYQIGALHSKRWGWYAVGFLLLTLTFIKSARAIALDMYPCVITTACFYIVYSASVLHLKKREYWIFPLLILGFVFRGPIGLVMPTGVVCIYFLLARQLKKFFMTGLVAFSLLILCGMALLWLAYHAGGIAFMQDVFRMQVGGRINTNFLPVYFYFTNSFLNYALAYPFALFVLAGVLVYRHRLVDYKILVPLTGWVLVILLGMSIPGEKKVRYILPMVPALALLASYPLAVSVKQRYFATLKVIFASIILFMPAILSYLAAHVAALITRSGLVVFYPAALPMFFAVVQVASIVLYFTVKKSQRLDVILFAAVFCFLTACFELIEPAELAIDRGRNFVAYVESARKNEDAELVFYRERPDGLPIKYMINMPHEDTPVFLLTDDELQAYKARAFFISSKSYYENLSSTQKKLFVVVATGKLGHVNIIVFRRKHEQSRHALLRERQSTGRVLSGFNARQGKHARLDRLG